MEGRLRERLDVLRRHIAAVTRAANANSRTRNTAWIDRWKQREDELIQFIDTMDGRAAQRAEWTTAELADETRRAEAILDETRRQAELSLRRMVADEQRYAVIETDPSTRRMMLQGTRPGTLTGEFFRFLADLKGFPVAFTQRQLGRAIYGYGDEAGAQRLMHQGAHLGGLIVGMTALGMVGMAAKDLVRGYGLRELEGRRPQP